MGAKVPFLTVFWRIVAYIFACMYFGCYTVLRMVHIALLSHCRGFCCRPALGQRFIHHLRGAVSPPRKKIILLVLAKNVCKGQAPGIEVVAPVFCGLFLAHAQGDLGSPCKWLPKHPHNTGL